MDFKKFTMVFISVAVISLVCGLIALSVIGVSVPAEENHLRKKQEAETEKETKKQTDEFVEKQINIEGDIRETLPTLNDGNEPQVTDLMHKMTHQKVVSDEKWGAIEMTPENIAKLKQHVLANNFKSKEFFLEILNRWETGNFDKADKDHNALWEAQGGTVGIAYDLMTEKQEKQFIERNFR
ncbi:MULTISPECIES: DUF6241 domain-containing protein [Bacillaceae]|uniref:DUF6241 domain-containing protein n=1 Tax=Bacillaceae TaxID=186817 RepID=UPI000E71B5D1|nr:DUF6241 domain-containing protein [Bacillus sp. PK3_68]RJS61625.1 hypothetical protein CJ483_17640 [Bacillus sp. PK3_68]